MVPAHSGCPPQPERLQGEAGHGASVVIGVLVGATMIASAVAAQVFRQFGPHYLARTAEVAFAVSLVVAAVLVIRYLGQMTPRRRDRRR